MTCSCSSNFSSPELGRKHKLEVVQDDVCHILSIDGVARNVEHLSHLSRSVKPSLRSEPRVRNLPGIFECLGIDWHQRLSLTS